MCEAGGGWGVQALRRKVGTIHVGVGAQEVTGERFQTSRFRWRAEEHAEDHTELRLM